MIYIRIGSFHFSVLRGGVSRLARDRAAQQPPPTTLVGFPDRLAGLLEVLGPEMSGGAVHVDDLTARSVYPLDPAQLPTPIANLAHRRAAGYGVTNELSTMTPTAAPSSGPRPCSRQGSVACVTAPASIPAPVPAASPCSDRPASTPGAGPSPMPLLPR